MPEREWRLEKGCLRKAWEEGFSSRPSIWSGRVSATILQARTGGWEGGYASYVAVLFCETLPQFSRLAGAARAILGIESLAVIGCVPGSRMNSGTILRETTQLDAASFSITRTPRLPRSPRSSKRTSHREDLHVIRGGESAIASVILETPSTT